MKETIIFLHGMVGNQNVFKVEMEKLKDEYNCISYDYYNPSSLGADVPFSLELLLEQLYVQYKKHGVKKAHLCTLSFGCIVAMAFYQKYPHMVSSLTFIGGYCCKVPSEFHGYLTYLLQEKMRYEHKVWLRRCASLLNPNKKQIAEDSEAIFVKSAYVLHPNVFEKALKLQLDFDSRKALVRIKAPVLWIMGQYDELYKGTLMDLKKYMPDVEYREIENAGHVAHIHQPDPFMSIFRQFLNKISKQEKALLNL